MGLSAKNVISLTDEVAVERIVAIMTRAKPAFVLVQPNVAETICEFLSGRERLPEYRPTAIICSGANLSDAVRARVRETFGAPVLDSYGLREVGLVGSECMSAAGMHVDESSVMIECIDSDGNPVEDGTNGELVVSSLSNEAMPFVRYRTGDHGALDYGRCPCGIVGTRIVRLVGREIPNFVSASGVAFSPKGFNRLFRLFPLREFQMIQRTVDQFEVLVEFDSSVREEGEMVDRIGMWLQEALGRGVVVAVRTAVLGRGGKFQRYRTMVSARGRGALEQ